VAPFFLLAPDPPAEGLLAGHIGERGAGIGRLLLREVRDRNSGHPGPLASSFLCRFSDEARVWWLPRCNTRLIYPAWFAKWCAMIGASSGMAATARATLASFGVFSANQAGPGRHCVITAT
jgi:hypothetical protein